MLFGSRFGLLVLVAAGPARSRQLGVVMPAVVGLPGARTFRLVAVVPAVMGLPAAMGIVAVVAAVVAVPAVVGREFTVAVPAAMGPRCVKFCCVVPAAMGPRCVAANHSQASMVGMLGSVALGAPGVASPSDVGASVCTFISVNSFILGFGLFQVWRRHVGIPRRGGPTASR